MSFLNSVPLIDFLAFTTLVWWRVIWLKKAGIKVTSKTENKNPAKNILYLVFGLLFILWLSEIVQPVFFKSSQILPQFISNILINSNLLKITGILLNTLSLVLWIITLLHFNTSLRFGLDQNNSGKLITSGIFAITRNPFFISIDLYFLGNTLIFPNLFFIGFAVLAVVSIHFFILKEEKFLQKNYGEEYKEYVKKVRRYF